MSTMRTNFPLKLRMEATSMMLRPVTLTADTEVNRASLKLRPLPLRVISGIQSRPAPMTMSRTKLVTSKAGGLILMWGSKRLALPISRATKSKK